MRPTKFLRRLFNSNDSVNSDSGCDVNAGIQLFVNCGVGSIIEAPFIGAQLQNTVVPINDGGVTHERRNSSSSKSSKSSKSSNDDNEDGPNTITDHRGVQVMGVNLGSFAHGLGLRENDIILTVNDRRVETAEKASILIDRIIERNKYSRLALEIQRFERGLIRLDNGGDEIEVEEVFEEDEVRILSSKPQECKLKHFRYKKYLIVKDGRIRLSSFKTKTSLKQFELFHYHNISEETTNKYARIQHKSTKKCLYVEDGELKLKDAPSGYGLPANSGYLFNMNAPTNSEHETSLIRFETVSDTEKAVGFTSKRGQATLLSKTKIKVLFNPYLTTSS